MRKAAPNIGKKIGKSRPRKIRFVRINYTLVRLFRSFFRNGCSLPAFVKPVTPKQFRGTAYSSPEELTAECRGLPPDTAVLVAEPVTLTAEVRSFVLDAQVLDAAVYEGNATLADAIAFITELVQAMRLPRTVVVDVGFVAKRGWAVIEFNATWGAGLNGCNATNVLPAMVAASGGLTERIKI
jgi:hypothetical protein